MIQQSIYVQNKLGLHARAAAKLVSLASKYSSETQMIIKKTNVPANCKSIMGIMMLGASKGTEVDIISTGNDEQSAHDAIIALFDNKFGEE